MQFTKTLAAVFVSLTMAGSAIPSNAEFFPQEPQEPPCKTPPCKQHEPTEPAHSPQSTMRRLSLNPYGSLLEEPASIDYTQAHAPIELPAGRPGFAQGFTVPEDYKGGPLVVELLVESEAVGCNFNLRNDFVRYMGMHSGNGTGGLKALSASSFPYSLPHYSSLLFAAPNDPDETVKLRFEITEGPFEPGDGIHFGLYRVAGGK